VHRELKFFDQKGDFRALRYRDGSITEMIQTHSCLGHFVVTKTEVGGLRNSPYLVVGT
jgi:hypothetical protein